ncbi:MAG: glycosyltransferase family 2 protein [Terriglobales bacterium]
MSKHSDAILAVQEGRIADALRLLEELLASGETPELWNDWAAAKLAAGDAGKAEEGFVRALELDGQNTDATTNLGLLLLGRGDSARAVPLLTRALPALPPDQQTIVTALLAAQKTEEPAASDKTASGERNLRVLVINDHVPEPKSDGLDLRIMQLLRALRTQGDEVTFIAREADKSELFEPLLHQAEIRTYSGDAERLPCLGREASQPSWRLLDVVGHTRFDIAILIDNFGCGLSVAEQYLDDLRQHSPATRIAVFTDELHAPLRASDKATLLEFEKTQDWATRQQEIFQRADVVLVLKEEDAASLRESDRGLRVEVIPHYLRTVSLASVQPQILSLTPKLRPDEVCSVMQVEKLFAERLASKAGKSRTLGQLECYARLAEQMLLEGRPEKAREQLRHIAGRFPEIMQGGAFASQVYILLKRCYRVLGDMAMAERCAAESRRCAVVKIPPVSRTKRKTDEPLFSVIVPTYNRLPILKKCLAALQAQTLAANDFEVIVIDDGSSDGTEEMLRNYRAPFRFQYLRQTNSGTGAARRNGVAHASGEFLLLMNDDTICDRDALKEHLQVQREYASEHWAVLGNFVYPAAARQRALTRYFCVDPFMFPQVSMEEGCPYGYSQFITCNLSVRRDAVVEAGSFDSTYKLSEDTELGIRLYERGYRVLYHPDAHAFHDHLPYPARNLIRRARVYGADYFYMFGRHPRVMKEWPMPVKLTAMDEENAIRIIGYVEEHRQEVEQAMTAVERWDTIDFEPFLADGGENAVMVLGLLRQAVPAIHWFYLFETMLQTMIRELNLSHLAAKGAPLRAAAQSAGG